MSDFLGDGTDSRKASAFADRCEKSGTTWTTFELCL